MNAFCAHCGEPATVLIALQEGCFARPDDHEQWLCEYHYERKSPRSGWWLIRDLYQPQAGSTPVQRQA